MLSAAQQQHYWEQGYVLVPHLLGEDRLSVYNQRFEAFASGAVAPSPMMKIMRDIMVVKGAVEPATRLHAVNKLINFEDDPALYEYVLEPALLSCVRSLLGADLFSVSSNVFNKPPSVDGRHPFHQDLRYFRLRPADNIVGVWTAMFLADREAGCLAVVPGSHKGEFFEHGDPDWEFVNAGFFAAQGADISAREYVEMQPGDTLLFHPMLLHGSGHNRSNRFRRAISAHFAAANCESPRRDWRQGKQARQIP